MPTDAKLGLLAGVAGVVAVAVLFFQDHPAAPPAAPPATTSAPAPTETKPAAPPIFSKKSDRTKPPATGPKEPRPEVLGQPVSRTADE